MEITEVRIKLVHANNDKLRAFCSITFDHDFVVRDLKVIEGTRGPFVAMPSRKFTQRCPRCKSKNPQRANFCNECGSRFQRSAQRRGAPQGSRDPGQRVKLHADIAHPINQGCRERIQKEVLERYTQELEKSQAPDYQPQALDTFEENYFASDLTDDAFVAGPSRYSGDAGPAPASSSRERDRTGGRPPERSWDRRGGRVAPREPSADDRTESLSGASISGRRPLVEKPVEKPVEPVEETQEPEDNFGAGLFS